MLSRSRSAAVSALLALSTAAASAQTPPAPATAPPAAAPGPAAASPSPTAPSPAAQAPAQPPAPPEASPEKLAVARELVEASGMARSFDPMVQQLEQQIPVVITRSRPDLAKDLPDVLTQLHPDFDKRRADMLDSAARIYARYMSLDDLKATVAFYSSSAGKKYVLAQPIMLDDLVVAMQAWTQETSTYMMKRVREEIEKKGEKF